MTLTVFDYLISWRRLKEKLLAGFYGNMNSKIPSGSLFRLADSHGARTLKIFRKPSAIMIALKAAYDMYILYIIINNKNYIYKTGMKRFNLERK
jgi:hypothetical protein